MASADCTNRKSRWLCSFRHASMAPWLALLACALFCLNGELLQALQLHAPHGEQGPSPGLNLLFCHLGGLVFAPGYLLSTAYDVPMVPPGMERTWSAWLSSRPRSVALLFALVIMGYNYCWLWSAKLVAVSVTTALFQTSAGMVYAISVPLFGEQGTFARIMGIGLLILGSMMASGATSESYHSHANVEGLSGGVALALMAALGVALYQVVFRHLFGCWTHDARFLAFFGAWVSVWHVLVVLPLLCLASASGLESLDLPRGYYTVLGVAISAMLASIVNIIYLCITLWGSVMLLPCANALSVPGTVFLDIALRGVQPSRAELLGDFLVVLGVVLVMDIPSYFFGVHSSSYSTKLLPERYAAEFDA